MALTVVALTFRIWSSALALASPQDQEVVQVAVIPYWTAGGGFDSVLGMNNTLVREVPLRLLLLDPEGEVVAEENPVLGPREQQSLSLAQLIDSDGTAQWGSIRVEHQVHPQDVGIQLSVQAGLDVAFDVPSSERPQHRSLRLRSAALPQRHKGRLILTNSAEEPRQALLTVRGAGRPQSSFLELAPAQTLSVDLGRSSAPFLVEVESDSGLPGEIAGGILWTGPLGIPAGYQPLRDPATRTSSRLSMAGLYGVGRAGFDQVLLLHNATPDGLTVQARLRMEWEGDSAVEDFSEELAPFESKEVNLNRWTHGLDEESTATLDLWWEGPPDALEALSKTVEHRSGRAFPNPLTDPDDASHRQTSNYPIRFGDGYNTLVQIKNPSADARRVVAHIFLSDGSEYDFGRLMIEAGQVHGIDLARLQREAVPDPAGRVLPEGPMGGQLLWFAFDRPNDLVGRAVHERDGTPVASLSCISCGIFVPDSFSIRLLSGEDPVLEIGLREETTGKLIFVDCGGGGSTVESLDEVADFYTSSNTAVATVDNNGDVTAVAPGTATIRGFRFAEREICQLATCTVIGFTIVQLVGQEEVTVPTPTLACESPVTRGEQTTCTIADAGTSTISNWRFESSVANVNRSSGQSSMTWSGTMVQSGMVKVTVGSQALSATVNVNARDDFDFTAVAANQKPNGFNATLTVANPPTASNPATGFFEIMQAFSFSFATVSGGPNHGFKYVTEVSNANESMNTTYFWVISQAVESSSSEFFMKQCGNYDKDTNPNGFISGSQLRHNTIHHESANSANSHYHQYKTAQDSTANNLGLAAESQVGAPSVSSMQFTMDLQDLLNDKGTAIVEATEVEPCDGSASKDGADGCKFNGFLNFPPYQTCN